MKHLNKFQIGFIYRLLIDDGVNPQYSVFFEILERTGKFISFSTNLNILKTAAILEIDPEGNEYISIFKSKLYASNLHIPADDICPDPGVIDNEIFNQLF